jgi:hypothetical protein
VKENPLLTPTHRTQALIDLAHRHLEAAAACALHDDRDPVGGPAFAGQIRLAAASLPPCSTPVTPEEPVLEPGVTTHLRHALTALDQIRPLDGPPHLPLCAWHVHELFRIAHTAGAA